MKAFEYHSQSEYWAFWEATTGYLLSDENVKQLQSFKTTDDAINWLFLNGYKDAAYALNKHVKDNSK